uniref:Uncharacterized protein n=1 Tax=Anguilla anguilla TaxID=7936 RepID=A0A0E9P655_ANGAN
MLCWATCAVSYCDRRALKRNQPEAFPCFMRGRARFPPANLSLELRELPAANASFCHYFIA